MEFRSKAFMVAAGMVTGLALQSSVCASIVDDHFDDGAIGSNTLDAGTGFTQFSNGGAGGSASEAGTLATITSDGNNDNSGISSNDTIDPTSVPGMTATWIVDSLDPGYIASQHWLDNDQGFDFSNGLLYVQMRATDNSIAVVTQAPGESFEFLLDAGSYSYDVASSEDGYTVTATITPAGWSYTFEGLDITDLGTNTAVNTVSGSWSVTADYSSIFDSDVHVAQTYQRAAGGSASANIDRITFGEVPEPASLALMGIGGLLLLRRRA